MSTEDTKYDDTLFTMAKQSGGVQEFLNHITSFLRRRTNFFTEAPKGKWKQDLLNVFHKEHTKLVNAVNSTKSVEADATDTHTIKADKLKPNDGKGCNLANFAWTQTLNEIELKIPLKSQQMLRARDVNVEINKKSLKVGLKGQMPQVNGELSKDINHNESTWMLVEGNIVNLTLEKVNKNVWFNQLMLTDPVISLEEIEPEKVKLTDLNVKEHETVAQMWQKQQQKQLGLPSKIEHKKMVAFENFKEMHPELDFSKCKFKNELKNL